MFRRSSPVATGHRCSCTSFARDLSIQREQGGRRVDASIVRPQTAQHTRHSAISVDTTTVDCLFGTISIFYAAQSVFCRFSRFGNSSCGFIGGIAYRSDQMPSFGDVTGLFPRTSRARRSSAPFWAVLSSCKLGCWNFLRPTNVSWLFLSFCAASRPNNIPRVMHPEVTRVCDSL